MYTYFIEQNLCTYINIPYEDIFSEKREVSSTVLLIFLSLVDHLHTRKTIIPALNDSIGIIYANIKNKMNRSARRHRSTKVPNVKLRPAPKRKGKEGENDEDQEISTKDRDWKAEQDALKHYTANRISQAAGKRKAIDQASSDEEEGEEVEQQEGKIDDLAPLVGCVICTTGFEETKVDLHECAVALGAQVEGNLTEGTTHLIAERTGTEKYYWAIKLGMPVLRPEWLKDLRRRWQKAEPIMFDDLVEEYRLDTFQGLTMAMAGVMDVEKRKAIRQKIKGAGGSTPQTFKLDGTFTHLLCEESKTSETLQVVQKYLKKAERYLRRAEDIPEDAEDASLMHAALKLKIVWIDWLDDCLSVNGCINEKHYQINQARPLPAKRLELVAQIQKSTKENAQRMTNNMKRARATLSDPTATLKRSKAQEHELPKAVNKKPNIGLNRLMEQLGQSSSETNVLKEMTPTGEVPKVVPAAKEANEKAKFDPAPEQREEEPVKEAENVERLSEAHVDKKGQDQRRKFENRESVDIEEENEEMLLDNLTGPQHHSREERSLNEVTLRIDLRDEVKNEKILKALQRHNLTNMIDAQDARRADFHILPLHKVHVESAPHLGNPVTHFFIERCLIEGRIIGTDEGFALQPSSHVLPLVDAANTFVSVTGLGSNENGPDRYQCEMALEVAGIRFSSILKKGVHTHLLVGKLAQGSASSEVKIDRAKRWGIPIVGLDFIDEIYRRGTITSYPPNESSSKSITSTMADISATSEGNSTVLNETQAPNSLSIMRSKNDNKDRGQLNELSSFGKRPFQRIVSANVPIEVANSPKKDYDRKSEPPPDSQSRKAEMDVETQVLRRSTHQMLELLNGHDQAMERNSSGNGAKATLSSYRKTRKLPPSMRNRSRRTSRTPTSEDYTEDESGKDVSGNLDVEELLARGREQEALQLGTNDSSSINPFAVQAVNEESMRIIYDDPASRRERRKIEAMINHSKQKDEVKQKHDVNPASSTPSKVRPKVVGVSPTIKARRQPGTANRDV